MANRFWEKLKQISSKKTEESEGAKQYAQRLKALGSSLRSHFDTFESGTTEQRLRAFRGATEDIIGSLAGGISDAIGRGDGLRAADYDAQFTPEYFDNDPEKYGRLTDLNYKTASMEDLIFGADTLWKIQAGENYRNNGGESEEEAYARNTSYNRNSIDAAESILAQFKSRATEEEFRAGIDVLKANYDAAGPGNYKDRVGRAIEELEEYGYKNFSGYMQDAQDQLRQNMRGIAYKMDRINNDPASYEEQNDPSFYMTPEVQDRIAFLNGGSYDFSELTPEAQKVYDEFAQRVYANRSYTPEAQQKVDELQESLGLMKDQYAAGEETLEDQKEWESYAQLIRELDGSAGIGQQLQNRVGLSESIASVPEFEPYKVTQSEDSDGYVYSTTRIPNTATLDQIIADPNGVISAIETQKGMAYTDTEGVTEALTARHMTDTERYAYFLIREEQGPDAAQEYYEELKWRSLYARVAEEEQRQAAEFADEHPIMGSIASVGSNILSTATGAAAVIAGADNENDPRFSFGRYTQTTRDTVGQNIAEAVPMEKVSNFLGFNPLQVAYSAAMSGIDSLTSLVVTGGSSAAAAGFQAVGASGSSYMDAIDRGLDVGKARLSAIGSGAIEYLTEKLPLDKLMKTQPADTIGGFLKNLIMQGATEAGEEAASYLANEAYSGIVEWDESELTQRYEDLTQNGYSSEGAVLLMAREALSELAASTFGGFVSGAGMGAGATAIETAQQGAIDAQTGQQIISQGNAEAIIRAAEEYDGKKSKSIKALANRLKAKIESSADGTLPDDAETRAETQVLREELAEEGVEPQVVDADKPDIKTEVAADVPAAKATEAKPSIDEAEKPDITMAADVSEKAPEAPARPKLDEAEKPDISKPETQQEETKANNEAISQFTGSPKKLGRLYRRLITALELDVKEASKAERREAIMTRLEQLGEKASPAVADAIAAAVEGEDLSRKQADILEAAAYAKPVLNELLGSLARNSSDWTSRITSAETMRKEATISSLRNATRERISAPEPEVAAETEVKVAEGGVATVTDGAGKAKEAQVVGIADAVDGVLQAVVKVDGKETTVPLSQVQAESEEQATIISRASQMGDSKAANKMISLFKGGDAAAFADAFTSAYEYGTTGGSYTLEQAKTSARTTGLSAEQIKTAYDLGAARAAAEANESVSFTGGTKGKLTLTGRAASRAAVLDANQKSAIHALRRIAEATGINIEVFESAANEKGEFASENGSFNRETNTIRIDINAGKMSKASTASYALLRVAGHELTHYIRANNRAGYQALQDFAVQVLTKQDSRNFDEMVAAKQDAYERQFGKGLSYEDAVEEVVADACEMMLKDSTAIQQLAQKNRSLFKRIRSWITNFVNAVKRAFQGVHANSDEAKAMLSRMDELQKMWDDALIQAVENTKAAGQAKAQPKKARAEAKQTAYAGAHIDGRTDENMPDGVSFDEYVGAGDVKYSIRKVNGKDVVWIEGNILKDKPADQNYADFIVDYLTDHIGEMYTIIESGQHVYLGKDLPKEYAWSRYSQRIRERNQQLYRAKARTAAGLGEAINIATNRRWEKTKHPQNKDAKYGIYKYDSKIAFPMYNNTGDIDSVQAYDVTLVIRNASNGKKYLYDIQNIKNDAVTANTLYFKSRGAANKAAQRQGIISESSIASPAPEVKEKFSLRNPVEQTKSLIAVHNLTADKLLKSLKLGGFPMPSIAITKASFGHQNFGDISLVFGKETIDPQFMRRNTVYSADAWTPTFPNIEYEADSKVEKRIRDKYYALAKEYGYDFMRPMYGMANYLEDELNRYGGEEGIVDHLRDDTNMMQVYIAETKGAPVEKITRENRTSLEPGVVQKYDYFIEKLGEDVILETAAKNGESPMNARKAWLEKHGDAMLEMYMSFLVDEMGMDAGVAREVFGDANKRTMNEILREVIGARNYLKNGAETVTVETDTEATNAAIRKAAVGYEAWLKDLVSGAVKNSGVYNNKDRFTASGNRRSFSQLHYPATLENIAKAMSEQNDGNTRNVSGFHGVKSLRAGTAARFKSIADMHALEDRLQNLTEAEAEVINDALSKRLDVLTNKIYDTKPHSQYGNSFMEFDAIGNMLMEAAELKDKSIESIKKVCADYQYKLNDGIVQEIRELLFDVEQMPVRIFEAKPERAVRFDEVKYAVVPDDMNADVRTELEKVVSDVRVYPSGDENARLEMLNQQKEGAEDVKFQLRDPYNLTDREMLVGALETAATSDAERDALGRYRGKIAELYALEEQLAPKKEEISAIYRSRGKRDIANLNRLKAEAAALEEKISKADKQLLNLESTAAMKSLLEREKARLNRKASAEKKAALGRVRERRDATELRHKIRAVLDDFNRRLKAPTEKKYIPANFVGAVIAAGELINTDSKRGGEKAAAKIAQIRGVYEQYKSDPMFNFAYDEVVASMLDNLQQIAGNKSIYQLGRDELQAVYDVVKALKKQVTEAVQLKAGEYGRNIIEVGREMALDTIAAEPIFKNEKISDLLNWHLSPNRFFARLGGYKKGSAWTDVVADSFNRGTETMYEIQRDFYNHFREFSENKLFDTLTSRKKLVDIGLKDKAGEKIEVTRGMMLSIYMHLLNEDNRRGIMYGGLTIPDLAKYYNGKMGDAYGRGSTMTIGTASDLYAIAKRLREDNLTDAQREALEADFNEAIKAGEERLNRMMTAIEKQLTDFEKKLIKAAQAWNDGKSQQYINDVTMDLYGIKKANVKNYWRIHRDTSFIQTDFDSISKNVNLENWGSLKARVPSQAPVLLTDFAFEMDSNMQQMSRYVGFARAQRDFKKLYNVRLPGMDGSVKKAVASKFGTGKKGMGVTGEQYIENFIGDITGSRNGETAFWGAVRRNIARASLSLNIRVAASQLSAIPTAAAEVGWGSMLRGLKGVKNLSKSRLEQISQDNVWFWQRYRGDGGMREFADMKGGGNFIDKAYNWLDDKTRGWVLNWCQKADVASTAIMHAMAEDWAKKNTNHTPGTDAFKKAVNDKYSLILRNTQPNYTATEAADVLRDKRETVKMFTMFKTQNYQNFNMLYDAMANLRKTSRDLKNKANGVTHADLKLARQRVAAATTSVMIGANVAFSLLRLLVNAITQDMDSYRDENDELSVKSVGTAMLSEMLSSISGMVFAGEELYNLVYSRISDQYYYGLNDSAISEISDLVSTAANGDWTEADTYKKLGFGVARVLGIPAQNMTKYFSAVSAWMKDIKNDEVWSFEGSVSRSKSTNYNRMLEASIAGDEAKWNAVKAELLEDPDLDEDEILSGYRGKIGDAYKEGELSYDEAARLLVEYGEKSEEQAYWQLDKWDYSIETGSSEDYDKYRELSAALVSGNTASIREQIKIVDENNDTQDTTVSIVKTRVRDLYVDGEINATQAKNLLKNYCSTEKTDYSDADTVYWQMKEWDFAKVNEDPSDRFSKYDTFLSSIEKGGSGMQKAAQELLDHGTKKESISSAIATAYKEQYVSLYKTNPTKAAQLLEKILNAYETIGYSRSNRRNYIAKYWFKEEDDE